MHAPSQPGKNLSIWSETWMELAQSTQKTWIRVCYWGNTFYIWSHYKNNTTFILFIHKHIFWSRSKHNGGENHPIVGHIQQSHHKQQPPIPRRALCAQDWPTEGLATIPWVIRRESTQTLETIPYDLWKL